ncbi:MAG TPA: hypothetical protein VFA07_08840 [Chthonomonadaceae bacterium]|nr:hypothetical protein [Chthonomonadaceae bacterium]
MSGLTKEQMERLDLEEFLREAAVDDFFAMELDDYLESARSYPQSWEPIVIEASQREELRNPYDYLMITCGFVLRYSSA